MSFFKVIKSSWENKLCSTSNSSLAVEYKVGEWAYPQKGKLFVFDNFEDAYDFYILYGSAIYQCDIMGEPETVSKIARYFVDIEDFWKEETFLRITAISKITPPCGTKLVEAVKLIRQVKKMTDKNIEEMINLLTTKKETFSAWNVTQKLRAKGYWAEHDRVRQYVHDCMKNSTDYSDYNNGNYIEYVPLAQPAQGIQVNTQAVIKNCTVQNTKPTTVFSADVKSKGRVTIPASIVKGLNLTYGSPVYFNGKEISKQYNHITCKYKRYTVDKYNEIRVPVKQTGVVTVKVYTDHLEIV